jgi:hypothetical protein
MMRVPDTTLHIAAAAVVFCQLQQRNKRAKVAMREHLKAHPHRCEVVEAQRLEFAAGYECYVVQRPSDEWCSYCVGRHQLWAEQQRVSRDLATARRRLERLCAKVDGPEWLQ